MLSFVVQARLGSTRLPGKIIKPFYQEDSIFELLLKKLIHFQSNVDCIVATSTDSQNDFLESLCQKYSVKCYRGDENDVLGRFIQAAEHYGVSEIIRVCSDNPFLDVDSILQLINCASSNQCDYISFNIDGTPSIKTHYGFWTEYVTLDSLKRVQQLTNEAIYHEHVTNYIYAHPDLFRIEWLDVSEKVKLHKNIRLTIDTIDDFKNAQEVYSALYGHHSIDNIIEYINTHDGLLESMRNQIITNSK